MQQGRVEQHLQSLRGAAQTRGIDLSMIGIARPEEIVPATKALGIEVPATLLARADDVIE